MNLNPFITRTPQDRSNLLKRFKSFTATTGVGLLVLAGLAPQSALASSWTGGAADNNWDNLANWDSNPSGGNGEVNTLTAFPILTANNTLVPNDLKIAVANPSSTGRVDVRAGIFTINYWAFIGDYAGNATFNIADTATTGGTYTGFGLGSGSFDCDNNGNGNFMVGLYNSTGVVNMNTSGSLNATEVRLNPNSPSGSPATFNLDNGTVNVAGSFQVGSDFWGPNLSTAIFNMSGGSVTAGYEFWTGGSGTGTSTQTGGAITNGTWFVIGRNNGSVGTYHLNGGTVTKLAGTGTTVLSSFAGSQGRLNVNGGTLTSYENMLVGEGGTGTVNLTNGTVMVANKSMILGVNSGSAGTVNLVGGTLGVGSISKGAGSGTFNFNGGTLRPTASTATFMQGLTAANVQAGGAVIDTDGKNITVGQALLNAGGGLTKTGNGTLTLTGASTYNGTTTISTGTLALGTGGSINNSASIVVASGATFDVSAISYTLAAGQTLAGNGSVNGNVATASATANLAPGTSAGMLTFNHNLNLSAGGKATFELSTSAASGNDQAVVTGNLTLSSSVAIHISALSGTANLDTTADYVLFAVAGTTTGTMPALVWDGTKPDNYLNYTLVQDGNNIVLRYTVASAPTVTASAAPTSLTRNQATTLTAEVTPGSGSIASVTVDLTQIGGSASASLVLSNANVYTNTFVVASSATPGSKSLTVTVADNTTPTPLTGSAVIGVTVNTASPVWDGGAGDAKWSSNPNWAGDAGPGLAGDSVTFAGTVNTAPDMDNNYSVTSLSFQSGADSFTIGSSTSSALTSGAGGIVNNSANPQTLNVPVVLGAAQTLNAAAGHLTLGATLNAGGTVLSVAGPNNTTLSGTVSGAASLTKNGNGTLSLAGTGNSLGSALALNAGAVSVISGSDAVGNVHMATAGSGAPTATLNITGGGVLSSGAETVVFDGQNAGVAGTGTLNVTNGTLNSEGDLQLAYAGSGTGTVNVGPGGVINVASTTERWVILNFWDTTKGILNLNGGTVTLNAGTDVRFSVGWYAPGASVGPSAINLNSGAIVGGSGSVLDLNNNADNAVNNTLNLNGGTLTIGQIISGKANGSRVVNFNGGTLKPAASSAAFFASGAASAANVQAGGAVIDTDGKDITIARALLDGGGGGGLTKLGAGTLTLSGAGTYTGATTVSNGTLLVSGSLGGGAVTVKSGATLSGNGTLGGAVATEAGGTLSPAGTFPATLTVNNTVNLAGNASFRISATQNDQVAGVTTLTSGGTLNVTLDSGSLTGGEIFTLVQAAAYGGAAPTAGTLPALNPGLNWYLDHLPVDGSITVNRAPTAAALTMGVAQGDNATLTIIGGKIPPADPDGNGLTITAVGATSLSGSSVVIAGGGTSVTYTAPNNASGSDSFSYTVSDSRGGSVTETVTVTVTPASTGANMVAGSLAVNSGVATMQALGIPGASYQLQYTTSLNPVNWLDVTNAPVQASPANGTMTLTDSDAGGPSRFYRTRHVSGP